MAKHQKKGCQRIGSVKKEDDINNPAEKLKTDGGSKTESENEESNHILGKRP